MWHKTTTKKWASEMVECDLIEWTNHRCCVDNWIYFPCIRMHMYGVYEWASVTLNVVNVRWILERRDSCDRKQFITNSHCAFDSNCAKNLGREKGFSKFPPYSTFKINYFSNLEYVVCVCMSLTRSTARMCPCYRFSEQSKCAPKWMKSVFIKSWPRFGRYLMFIYFVHGTTHTHIPIQNAYPQNKNSKLKMKKKIIRD